MLDYKKGSRYIVNPIVLFQEAIDKPHLNLGKTAQEIFDIIYVEFTVGGKDFWAGSADQKMLGPASHLSLPHSSFQKKNQS